MKAGIGSDPQTMLKHRLIFGTLMIALFVGLVLLDGWLDGSLTYSTADDRPVQGTLVMLLVAAALTLGVLELSQFTVSKGLRLLRGSSVLGVLAVSTAWYWPQMIGISQGVYLSLALVLALVATLLEQNLRFGTEGTLASSAAGSFCMLYLGVLAAFFLAIRVQVGPWAFLAFVFVVKLSDTGAYTFGKLFGAHKLAPRLSPGKTWEGLAGAVVVASLVSIAFAGAFDIMSVWQATLFGASMAVAGQLSDLAESMLKRDAQQKDSSNSVPGFGGILDVLDSLLFAAPLAYVYIAMRG
jgi:phosphatidate cytidylyltransferase